MKLRKRNIILETQLKINERDFEKIENIEQENKQEMKRNLITDPSGGSGLIFNNIIGLDDWNKKDYNETFPLNVDIKKNFDIKINAVLWQNNEDLVIRAMSINEIRDSLILEKIEAQREAEKIDILARSQPDLGN